MTRKEFYETLERLREEYGEAFERWYDTANYPDIKDHCRTGYLFARFNPFPEEDTSQSSKT